MGTLAEFNCHFRFNHYATCRRSSSPNNGGPVGGSTCLQGRCSKARLNFCSSGSCFGTPCSWLAAGGRWAAIRTGTPFLIAPIRCEKDRPRRFQLWRMEMKRSCSAWALLSVCRWCSGWRAGSSSNFGGTPPSGVPMPARIASAKAGSRPLGRLNVFRASRCFISAKAAGMLLRWGRRWPGRWCGGTISGLLIVGIESIPHLATPSMVGFRSRFWFHILMQMSQGIARKKFPAE